LVYQVSASIRRSLAAPFYTPPHMRSVIVAVDLGGTNVRAAGAKSAQADSIGRIFHAPSQAQEGLDAVVQAVATVVKQAAGKASLAGVGIAVAGHVDGRVVRWSPNFGEQTERGFKMWRNVPFAQRVEEAVCAPVVLANDANAAALGEYYHGCGRGKAHSLFLFTLGTGVGTGLVVGGRMFSGFRGGAVEFGHVVIEQSAEPWLTGSPGPVEAFCGARGFEMRFGCTPAEMSKRAARGEVSALSAWREYGTWLGSAVGSAINAFAPEVVALGGGIAKAAKYFLAPCVQQARRVAVPSLWRNARVQLAERLEDAALFGALALAREELTR
jgi:glucokinase